MATVEVDGRSTAASEDVEEKEESRQTDDEEEDNGEVADDEATEDDACRPGDESDDRRRIKESTDDQTVGGRQKDVNENIESRPLGVGSAVDDVKNDDDDDDETGVRYSYSNTASTARPTTESSQQNESNSDVEDNDDDDGEYGRRTAEEEEMLTTQHVDDGHGTLDEEAVKTRCEEGTKRAEEDGKDSRATSHNPVVVKTTTSTGSREYEVTMTRRDSAGTKDHHELIQLEGIRRPSVEDGGNKLSRLKEKFNSQISQSKPGDGGAVAASNVEHTRLKSDGGGQADASTPVSPPTVEKRRSMADEWMKKVVKVTATCFEMSLRNPTSALLCD